jgi:hypothetical protein
MVEIEQTTVKLGEKEYTIQQAGFIRSRPWKKRLFEEIKPLFERFNGASDITFNSAADLFQLLPLAEDLFVSGIETIFELLIAYAPELEADRALIEAHATDKQILAGFQEVVRLSDPFGIVAQFNRRIGLKTNGTS